MGKGEEGGEGEGEVRGLGGKEGGCRGAGMCACVYVCFEWPRGWRVVCWGGYVLGKGMWGLACMSYIMN